MNASRLARWWLALGLIFFALPVFAQETPGESEKFLLDAVNRERALKNLQPLKWDANLAAAARDHLHKMVETGLLTHQFPSEPDLTKRAKTAGAHFSRVAENIAEAPTVSELHIGWMKSQPHRENILNPQLTAIGIAVDMRGTQYYAVQDFSTSVNALSCEEQEKKVGELLQARGMQLAKSFEEARKACDSSIGNIGSQRVATIHFEAPDLNQLPDQLLRTIKNGSYRTAAVGACNVDESAGFSRFRITILLY